MLSNLTATISDLTSLQPCFGLLSGLIPSPFRLTLLLQFTWASGSSQEIGRKTQASFFLLLSHIHHVGRIFFHIAASRDCISTTCSRSTALPIPGCVRGNTDKFFNVPRSNTVPQLCTPVARALALTLSKYSVLPDGIQVSLMGPHKRGPWSQAEDQYLLQLVQTQGAHNWVRISHLIQTRSPKQCRERFHQNLKPTLNHEPITPDEGELIERLVGEMGKRWAEIARRLRGRSDNAVKNWWNGGMNRRRRIVVRRDGQNHCPQDFDEKAEPLSFARPIPPLSRCAGSIRIPSHHQRIERPMISPATSDGSAADSLGDAPSLVSDSSSIISASPNGMRLTLSQLPPPNTPRYDSCYRPPPILHFESNEAVSDAHHMAPAPIEVHRAVAPQHYQRLHQFAEVATSSAPAYVPQAQLSPSSQRQYQLPHFDAFIKGVEKPASPAAKSRMSVSAVLD